MSRKEGRGRGEMVKKEVQNVRAFSRAQHSSPV